MVEMDPSINFRGPFAVKYMANNFTQKTKEYGKRRHYILRF